MAAVLAISSGAYSSSARCGYQPIPRMSQWLIYGMDFLGNETVL